MLEEMDLLIQNAYSIINTQEQKQLRIYDKEEDKEISNHSAYMHMKKQVINTWKQRNAYKSLKWKK